MKYPIESRYLLPRDLERERAIMGIAAKYGGVLYEIDEQPGHIEVWIELPTWDDAASCMSDLHSAGYHVTSWGCWDD